MPMKIKLTSTGKYAKAQKYLENVNDFSAHVKSTLDRYGEMGVVALKEHTPKATGKTSESWFYRTSITKTGASVSWYNSNYNDGVNIAIIIQYGHGTRTGGYVRGRDYINPALRPVFDEMEQAIEKELVRL